MSSQDICCVNWEKRAASLCRERSVFRGVSSFIEVQKVEATSRTTMGTNESEGNFVLPVCGGGRGGIQERGAEESGDLEVYRRKRHLGQ